MGKILDKSYFDIAKIFLMAVLLSFTISITPQAKAGGPANTEMVRDFFTNALDADGCFKLVHCSHAHQVSRGEVVKENYRCQFVDDETWGTPALPDSAMVWDYDNTVDLTGEGCEIPIPGPVRWFSDVEDILTTDSCFMYTNAAGEDIGDSSFRMVITPSGNVNVTVVYDPPVFEGDCAE